MTSRAAASRYAKALLEVAVRDGAPERVEADLARFAGVVAGHGELKRVLLHPAVPATRKRALVAAVIQAIGPLAAPVARLLELLADRDRVALVPLVVEAYRARLMDYRQVVRAEVASAVPLSASEQQAIERGLARAMGKQVALETRVEPGLIGGIVTRIGSVVYDGSVVRHLQRMKEKLVEEA
jgi:F-type H+-transporting ATPase subunit delta